MFHFGVFTFWVFLLQKKKRTHSSYFIYIWSLGKPLQLDKVATVTLDFSIFQIEYLGKYMGAQWLSGRVLDSRPRGHGFEPHPRHCVVSLNKSIHPSLVLVQPRKTQPFITERLLMGRKESNQTKKKQMGKYMRFGYLLHMAKSSFKCHAFISSGARGLKFHESSSILCVCEQQMLFDTCQSEPL